MKRGIVVMCFALLGVGSRALASDADFEKLLSVFRLDVISYYGLDMQYDTPLKQKRFMESAEYKEKLRQLERLRGEATARERQVVAAKELEPYNVEAGSFDIDIGSTGSGIGTMGARPPKSIDRFLFSSLPIEAADDDSLPQQKREFIVIKMPETKAAEIELRRQ